MSIEKILGELIKFNTIDDKENIEIMNWIAGYLSERGFDNKKIYNDSGNKCCLISQYGENPILGFSAHTDTVNYGQNWNHKPLEATIEGDKLYGLGSCDMKGGIACMLSALNKIELSSLKRGLIYYFTYDEEKGFEGINLLCNNIKEYPDYLVLAEPTDEVPIIGTKGCFELKVTFNGISTHSSTPDKGKNAIYSAMDFIEKLKIMYEKIKEDRNDLYSIPYTTLNVSTINGGNAINKVPDLCTITFDFRTIYSKHSQIILEELQKLCAMYDCKLEIINNILALNPNDENFVREMEKTTNHKRDVLNYVTEASFYGSKNAIILGSGPITAHEADEYSSIDSLHRTEKVYSKIISNYCK